MVLRIDASGQANHRTLRLSGRLDAPGLVHLLSACVPDAATLTLDLSDLRSLDADGCRGLVALAEAGAAIVGEPAFIRVQLAEQGRATASEDEDDGLGHGSRP
jgi:ABC-type transporter Mla MlaB component